MQANDKQTSDEAAVRMAIAAMPEEDRLIGERLHTLMADIAPQLMPRTWYGMPAYHNGSKIVCFFRSRKKFGERYMTFGFNDVAKLDEGGVWPVSFAIRALTMADEAKLIALVKKAVS